MTAKRQSIQPTYDSRETGPRYHVTTTIDGRVIGKFRHRVSDPFVHQTVHIGLRDLWRGLLRRSLTVEVTVGGDLDVMDDVLDLDANNLSIGPSTRRDEFNARINDSLGRFAR